MENESWPIKAAASREDLARKLAIAFLTWHMDMTSDEAGRLAAAGLSIFWYSLADILIARARAVGDHIRGEGPAAPTRVM